MERDHCKVIDSWLKHALRLNPSRTIDYSNAALLKQEWMLQASAIDLIIVLINLSAPCRDSSIKKVKWEARRGETSLGIWMTEGLCKAIKSNERNRADFTDPTWSHCTARASLKRNPSTHNGERRTTRIA